MNQVDTSAETVEREYNKIAEEFKILPAGNNEEPESQNGEFIGNEEPEKIKLSPEEFDEKKNMTKGFILSGLNTAFFALGIKEIPENIKEDFAENWAVVIVKRFPDNPVFDFMDEYGDLIAAGGSTLVLIGAIKQSKKIEKQQAQQAVKSGLQKAGEMNGN